MNKRGKSILVYSLLIAGIIICGLLFAGAAGLYNKGDSDLNINYRLVTEDLYGRHYTPDCFVDCHLTYCVSYSGDAASLLTSLSNQDVGQDFLYLDNSDSSILKDHGVDYLTTETYSVDIPEYGTCEGTTNIYDNKTGDIVDTEKYSYDCQTGSQKEERTRQAWTQFDGNVDAIKEKEICFDIWGKLQPGLNQKFAVDVIPKIKLHSKEFAMSEMAPWNQSDCAYRIPINITENNGTALVQYPVNASITASSNLDNPSTTVVLVDNHNETSFRWNTSSFTPGQHYVLFWETNVSVSSTGTDYLYYGCTGFSDKQSNVTSYSNPDKNTTLYLTFDEGSGVTDTVIDDKSSFGNDGTVKGTLASVAGQYLGKALKFDGNMNNYVEIPNSASMNVNNSDFTVEAWVNVTSDNSVIFSSINDGDPWNYLLFWVYTNKLRCQIRVGTTEAIANSTTSITDSKWHHVACVRTNNTLRVYVDGKYEGGDIGIGFSDLGLNNSYAKTVGRRRDGYYSFNGVIEEFRFSKQARNMSDIVPRSIEPSVTAGGESAQEGIANEAEGEEAILAGIQASTINQTVTIENNTQVYVAYLNNTQKKAKFDYIAINGNQRWAFNYTTGDYAVIGNLEPVLYVWQANNKNTTQITAAVKGLIDSTYQPI